MHHGDEGEHEEDTGAEEAPRSDRETGGPTADEDAEGTQEGAAHGTKPSQFDPHE